MNDFLKLKIRRFASNISLPKFSIRKPSTSSESKNQFIVHLLRGKKLYSFLFSVDCSISSSPRIDIENKIDIELPLTVLSDNRIDNEQELAEYIEDIVGYFDVGPTPSLLLLDPSYFFNTFVHCEDIDDINVLTYIPHIASDTVYKSQKLRDDKSWNLSFASSSLLKAWAACTTAPGCDCAYIGSFFYPLVQEISSRYDSFGLLDVQNSYSYILLFSDGKLVSKYLPFGVNQYLIADRFMSDDFINRLSKTIVKVSSDNALSSPKNIYFLSDWAIDTGSSRFFNLKSLSDLALGSSFDALLSTKMPPIDSQSANLNHPLFLVSLIALHKVLTS